LFPFSGRIDNKWESKQRMPMPNCEVEGVSLVLAGNFNPAIFHPSWLLSHGMIRSGEADHADVQVISPDVASFQTSWLTMQVTRDKFQASTADPRFFEQLRDLVLSIFGLLEHTPIRLMGINRDMHFVSSREIINKFGDLLAPKQTWKRSFEHPLLETLIMRGNRPGSDATAFRVTIQPSVLVVPGIYVGTNEHFEAEGEESTLKILAYLRVAWDESQRYSRQVADDLVSDIPS
jgi:hypothetical protein